MMFADAAVPSDAMLTVTVKLFAAQFDSTVVVAVGDTHAGKKVYASPPMGPLAGAVEVKRIVLVLAVPAKGGGVRQVSVPEATRKFFTFVAKTFVGPRKPTCGCWVVAALMSVTGPYWNVMVPLSVFMCAWKLNRSVPPEERAISRHCTTTSSPSCSQRISGVPVVALFRLHPKGITAPE